MKGAIKACDFCSQPAHYVGTFASGVRAYICDNHLEKYGSAITVESTITTDEPALLQCSLCGELKAVEDFYQYTDTRGKRRFRTECKACNLAERKAASFRRR